MVSIKNKPFIVLPLIVTTAIQSDSSWSFFFLTSCIIWSRNQLVVTIQLTKILKERKRKSYGSICLWVQMFTFVHISQRSYIYWPWVHSLVPHTHLFTKCYKHFQIVFAIISNFVYVIYFDETSKRMENIHNVYIFSV